MLKTYSGHGYEVLDAHSSGDNSQICSGGMDKSVILWDVASGKVLRKYRGHVGELHFMFSLYTQKPLQTTSIMM